MSKLCERVLAIATIVLAMPVSSVFGQYGQNANNQTAVLLERCAKLGIEPSDCSEQEILKKSYVCVPEHCDTRPDLRGPITFIILVGSGIAMAVGIVAVRALRDKRQQARS